MKKVFRAVLALAAFFVLGSSLSANAEELLVTSHGNNRVLRFEWPSGRFIDVFASGGGDIGSQGIAFGPDGNLYVGGEYSHNVVRYDGQTGEFIDVFVRPRSGGLDTPGGVTFGPDGNLYVNSYAHNQVLRYHGCSGEPMGVFASHPALNGATGLAFAPDGNLYVASRYLNLILQFDGQTGEFIDATGCGGLNDPHYLTFTR